MARDPRKAVEEALAVIDEREDSIRAWVRLDRSGALLRADQLRSVASPTLLYGLVLGVKDIFDTADLLTEYGSPIFAGYQPRADAAAVSLLRSAGAICLGKTVTTEMAMYEPGPTRNPHRLSSTPGGSSSGSAAAVASGMADIALGTQTAGSVIRPASFCGIWGMKPTFGSVAIAGVKTIAPSLDTVGWFARSAHDLDRIRAVLTGRSLSAPAGAAPRIGLLKTEQWSLASPDSRRAVVRAARVAREGGAVVREVQLPAAMDGLADRVPVVHAFEAARSLHWELATHTNLLSEGLRAFLQWGASIDPASYDSVVAQIAEARRAEADLFAEADAILTPAVKGEAPDCLTTTGDPMFARLWTAVGLPSIAVPGLSGRSGMPVGVQMVGRRSQDADLVAWSAWLGHLLEAGASRVCRK